MVPVATHVAETGSTYAENAALKAVAAFRASQLPAVGDDSGLELEALGGFPGLHSARVGHDPAARIKLVLDRLERKPKPWLARFVCELAVVAESGEMRTFRGETEGEIVSPRGRGGFGYDPIFLVPERGRTFAEMSEEEKNAYSHRGRAVRSWLESGWVS